MNTRRGGADVVRKGCVTIVALLLASAYCMAQAQDPPEAPREFRGVFVATAYNLDWPKKEQNGPGNDDNQKRHVQQIVRHVKSLNCNVVILQVRAFGDRLHKYSHVRGTWSRSLNKGRAPKYDPLAVWLDECHKQGIELHAWINPFRIDDPDYDLDDEPYEGKGQLWYRMNRAVHDHIINEVMPEILGYVGDHTFKQDEAAKKERKRKVDEGDGVDGVLIDHYVPPPPPDDGGKAMDKDQERAAVNAFIEDAFKSIQTIRPDLKFGLSPGTDQHDWAQPWLEKGWFNYIVPELYERYDDDGFKREWGWWLTENKQAKPIVVAGLNTARVVRSPEVGDPTWPASVISRQVELSREETAGKRGSGQVHYSSSALPSADIGDAFRRLYSSPAIVPSCVEPPQGWTKPGKPTVKAANNKLTLARHPGDARVPWLWEIWFRDRTSQQWNLRIIRGSQKQTDIEPGMSEAAVRAVDRFGLSSDLSNKEPL